MKHRRYRRVDLGAVSIAQSQSRQSTVKSQKVLDVVQEDVAKRTVANVVRALLTRRQFLLVGGAGEVSGAPRFQILQQSGQNRRDRVLKSRTLKSSGFVKDNCFRRASGLPAIIM